MERIKFYSKKCFHSHSKYPHWNIYSPDGDYLHTFHNVADAERIVKTINKYTKGNKNV